MGRNRFTHFLYLTLLVMLLINCAVPVARYDQGIDASGKPNWVSIGTQTSITAQGRVFIGVGYADTQGDFQQQANMVNNIAKQEVERMLQRYIEVMSRDYLARDVKGKAGYTEQITQNNISKVTAIILSNARIMEHWIDRDNKRIFAVAEIEYPQVASIILGSKQVNPDFKEFLKTHGEAVFDRIATHH